MSRYAPDFASVGVTQNSAIYAASALTSAEHLVTQEQVQEQRELRQRLTTAEDSVDTKQHIDTHQSEVVTGNEPSSAAIKQTKNAKKDTTETKGPANSVISTQVSGCMSCPMIIIVVVANLCDRSISKKVV